MSDPSQTDHQSADKDDEISLIELFAVLLKHRLLIIITTVVISLLVLGYALVGKLLPADVSYAPDEFTSTGQLLLSESSGGLDLGSQASALAGLAGVSLPSGGGYGLLAVDLAKSNSIVDRIADEYSLIDYESDFPRTNARKAIREMLSAELDPDTNIIKVSFTHWDRSLVSQVVNKVIELLDARFATIGINRNLTEKNLLETKLADVTSEMTRLEIQINEFQTRYGILTVEQLATETITALAQARSQLILKELEINTYSEFARIDDPTLRRLRTERDNLKQLIQDIERGSDVMGRPSQQQIPDLALQYGRLERDLRVQAEIYKILTQQYELTKLKVEGEGPIFQVLELGEVPEQKSGPSRAMMVIIGGFAGVFFSIFLAFIVNAIQSVHRDPEQMQILRNAMAKSQNRR